MPGPRRFSRHIFCQGFKDTDVDEDGGPLQLTEREPFPFRQYADNVLHIVGEGDTLFSLAARFYAGIERPDGLWWVIADFQPDPIIDPTIRLTLGSTLVIPSLRTVTEAIFNPNRRGEASL